MLEKKLKIIVDDSRVEQLQKELNKLEKKLNKIGGSIKVVDIKNIDNVYTDKKEYTINTSIELLIPDYDLIAVNKLNVDGTYLYMTIDNRIEVPETVKNTYICNHCNTKRKRKMYYIFYNKKINNFVSVGSTCCKEYVGVDIEKILKKYDSIYQSIGVSFDNEINLISTDINYIVSKIICYDKLYNTQYKNYRKYKENLLEFVNELVINSKYQNEYYYYDKHEKELEKEANKTIEYILKMNNKENNEYLHNLQQIFNNRFMDAKFIKYILYCTKLVQLDKVKKEANKENKKPSNYVGEIKDRLDLNLTLFNIIELEGYYGLSYLYLFKDNEGNIFKWITASKKLENNTAYKIKATIKNHEEYKGIKQTVLTRCKVL